MSELSVIKKQIKKGIQFNVSDAWIVLIGLCTGLLASSELAKIMGFCMMGYFFQKSFQEFIELFVFFLIGSLIHGGLALYQNSLIFAFFCLLVLFVKVIHFSMFHAMPWITGGVGFLIVLVETSNIMTSLQSAVFAFVLMKVCSHEKILIQRRFKVSEMMMSIMVNTLLMMVSQLLTSQQFVFVCALWMVLVSLTFDSTAVLMNAGLLYLMTGMNPDALLWLISASSVHFIKSMGMGLIILFPLICSVITKSGFAGIQGLMMISFALCLPERSSLTFLELENEDHLLKMRLRNKEHLLQHQLNQFAHIFDTIADYYEDSGRKETAFLKGMSESMSLLSMQMKQSALSQDDEALKILELLKGYHYDIQKVYVTQSDTGVRRVTILMNECVRKDVDDVILPLLRMSIDQNLKLISCQKAHKFSQCWKLEFSGKKPLGLKVKSYQRLDQNKQSGDTCSIFESGKHTICTISDGMGAGSNAKKTSGFVTYLTQRLVSCGMPIEMIVKSINSLCSLDEKESFATLDFMCFDALNHKAVIAKNGAAPSYLIRGKDCLKIEGHALPLGIIHKISADCYMLDVREKDILLMCSDGVDDMMLRQWLSTESAEDIRKTIENTIHDGEKRDDISVIVAEVL